MGHLAAASRKSPPVFCGRRGILTEYFSGSRRSRIFYNDGPMKKKNRKRRKRRQPARHAALAVHTKRRHFVKHVKVESVSVPWLRIVPAGIEDDPGKNLSRASLSVRNGRRHSPDFDLYHPGKNSRDR